MEITENKLKGILTEQREEFQRHVDKQMGRQREEYQRYLGVMKESFDSKVELIGEQYHSITEMIGSLTEDVHIIKSDVEFLKAL